MTIGIPDRAVDASWLCSGRWKSPIDVEKWKRNEDTYISRIEVMMLVVDVITSWITQAQANTQSCPISFSVQVETLHPLGLLSCQADQEHPWKRARNRRQALQLSPGLHCWPPH